MEDAHRRDEDHGPHATETAAMPGPEKQPWHEPRLTFVEPRLTRHGPVHQVTGAAPPFFGSLPPGP